MNCQRRCGQSKSVFHHLMKLLDAWSVWMSRNVVEPRTRAPAVARARVIPRRYRGAVDMRKR